MEASGLQVRGHTGEEGFLLDVTLVYCVFLKLSLWKICFWD